MLVLTNLDYLVSGMTTGPVKDSEHDPMGDNL